jgi:hypothetical protein
MKINCFRYSELMFNAGPIKQGDKTLGYGVNFAFWLIQILKENN